MIPASRMQEILDRFAYLEARMEAESDPAEIARLGRDYAGLEPVVATIREWQKLQADLAAAREMLAEPDMRALAEEEVAALEARLPALEDAVLKALLPRDADDERAAILEIRPGTGGAEAALFAGDLLRMYLRHAERQGWKAEILEEQPADLGGIREAILAIRGRGVFSRLKFESGVHRVQRVPVTESGGRIHTSAATVAVLPEPEQVEVEIDWEQEVEEHITTAQGPGGQNVNKVATACHLIHTPTGIEVRMQEAKSQRQNREKARRVLAARVAEMERERAATERSAERRSQIGGAQRAEKVRVYRYQDGIVADQRLEQKFQLREVLEGRLDAIFDALIEQETARRLAAL